MSGTLKKLKIIAFKDRNFSKMDSSVEVPINPASFSHGHSVAFKNTKTTDTGGVIQKFIGLQPQTLNFELYFDATLPTSGITSVQDAIDSFKEVTYDFDGELHSSKYLKVLWGSFQLKCRITTLNIEYTLFSPGGKPLRAKATAAFQEYVSPQALALLENKSSPDLTHIRTVQAGDALPLMCEAIYNDSTYYLAVARFNGLTHFRELKPGDRITFPPLA